jgi:hypothetical protein
MLLRVYHLDWQIAEKRLRRVRRELLSEAGRDKGEDNISDTRPEFKGFNKHTTYDVKNGRFATVFTAPGTPAPQQMIEEDGQEYQVLLNYGLKIETGRRFTRDDEAGEWVLDT